MRDADENEHGIAEFARGSNGGLIVVGPPSSIAPPNRDLVVRLAIQHLPAICATSAWVSAGGFLFYGSDPVADYRRAAGYVDRILKGEKPADLPAHAPTKYKLMINLKTAKASSLTIRCSMPPVAGPRDPDDEFFASFRSAEVKVNRTSAA